MQLLSAYWGGGGGAKSRTDLIDPNTADGIARFCTQGFAANFLTKQQNGGYVVDMRYMEPMRVRPGYRRYGGAIELDSDFKLKCVHYEGKEYVASDPEFLGAAFAVRTSVVLHQIGGVHGLHLHIFVSNWVTLSSRTVLPADHCLRRFLAPFTVGTAHISALAEEVI